MAASQPAIAASGEELSPEAAIAGSKPPSVRASSTMVWTGASSSTTRTTGRSPNVQTPPALPPALTISRYYHTETGILFPPKGTKVNLWYQPATFAK